MVSYRSCTLPFLIVITMVIFAGCFPPIPKEDMGSSREPYDLEYNSTISFTEHEDLTVAQGLSYFRITGLEKEEDYEIKITEYYTDLDIRFFSDQFHTLFNPSTADSNTSCPFLTSGDASGHVYFTVDCVRTDIEGASFHVVIKDKDVISQNQGSAKNPVEIDRDATYENGIVSCDGYSCYKMHLGYSGGNITVEVYTHGLQDPVMCEVFSDSTYETQIAASPVTGEIEAFTGIHKDNYNYPSGEYLYIRVSQFPSYLGTGFTIKTTQLQNYGSSYNPVLVFNQLEYSVIADGKSYHKVSYSDTPMTLSILHPSEVPDVFQYPDGTGLNIGCRYRGIIQN